MLSINVDEFDPVRFNWHKFSYFIAKEHPELIRLDLYNWENHSWAIPAHCPHILDKKEMEGWENYYNWKKNSWSIATHLPEKVVLFPHLFNWETAGSQLISTSCLNELDILSKIKDWEQYCDYELLSLSLIIYYPDRINPKLFNWEKNSNKFLVHRSDLFNDKYYEYFDWDKNGDSVLKYCPHVLKDEIVAKKYFNWSKYGWIVARDYPEYINTKYYDWENHSWAIILYCPHLLEYNK